ncbi:hypothetical protein KQ306_02560 [Synechococcus sp. CS-1324]|uniref:hypothetical protein n=1 Tax=Synechococcus sp. CS-1324 TaxID=2847980 RepID=UPI000DB1511D|nr:hypothetical protein [Synechococcus sp. CS-1324]MCT0229745.1 hypothetical protein [Synechococcus sp. CS-1324]PZV03404.1 MAG: hypothetical protein DCF23_09455 [Cyanobium sp.]
MLKSTWLDLIPGLWRDEAAHRYWLGEHLFPVSITGVLAHGLSATARRAIEAKRPVWEPRGNTVHAALERYSQARFSGGRNAEQALLAVEQLPGHHRYRDWILPLLQLPLWDEVQVIASERLSCCLTRNLAGGFDGAYASPALSDRRGREVRVLYDLKTLSAHGRPYSTAAQLGGYMVLEAAQGNHYDLGQTLWSKPGEAFTSTFYSREQCLAAWAAAWSRYCLACRPF